MSNPNLADIPDRYIVLAEIVRANEIEDSLLNGKGDYQELVWEEIVKILESWNRDTIEDAALRSIVRRVAKRTASKYAERGLLDIKANELWESDRGRQ